MEMTEQLKKSLIVINVCNSLLYEEMDHFKETTAYSQKPKQLSKNLQKALEPYYNKLHSELDKDERYAQGFYLAINLVDDFCEIITKNMKERDNLLELANLLTAYKKGNYKFTENDNREV
jgi:hypothetical protein